MNEQILRRGVVLTAAVCASVLFSCAGTETRSERRDGGTPTTPERGNEMMLVAPEAAPAAPAKGASAPASGTWATGKAPTGAAPAAAGHWRAVINGEETAAPAMAMGDEATLARIIDEGTKRNQVMKHLKALTDIGPRLTGSTRIEQADEWLRKNYTAWGLKNVHREQWGTIGMRFDRGPSKGTLLAAGSEPARELQFTTLSWTKGTNGPVKGSVVVLPAKDEEYDTIKAKVKGAWILVPAAPAAGQRGVRRGLTTYYEQAREMRKFMAAPKDGDAKEPTGMVAMAVRDGAAGFLVSSGDERVWTGSVNGWRTASVESQPPDIFVSVRKSDHEAIAARAAAEGGAMVEFDLKHTLKDGPIPVYNTIAEIPGTDLKDEMVIISAHLDSWDGPGSQGTTDNGTGTSVTLEAARILIAAGAKPRRTIRFVHWTGEEQGLLGSREYVKMHKDEMPKVTACFVDDGGTNSQGGIPCIESMREMLAAATAPSNNLFTDSASGKPLVTNVRVIGRMPRGGSSDHASFNAVGVPGFFWDEVGRADYGYGWHTQHDKYDLGVPEYLMQSATNSAIVAYRLACVDAMLPREQPAAPGATPAGEEPRPARPRPTTPPTTGSATPAAEPSN